MEPDVAERSEERVLVLAVGRDGELTCEFLHSAGLECQPCRSIDELCEEIARSPGAAVLAQEVLTAGTMARLCEALERQPPWSDLPVLVIQQSEETSDGLLPALRGLGMVTVLPRPIPVETLVSTVQSALHARRRQYQVRDLLHQREELDRRKDEFLAMLSHELRNPLAPIVSGAQIITAHAGEDPVIARHGAIISRQAHHMTRLLNDLLDVSRITSGKIDLQQGPVDLLVALRQAVETCRPLIEARRHRLRIHLPAGPVTLEADETRLQQIFVNLLNNAAKYTPPDGEITLSARVEEREAAVSIRDTGEGIPRELQPHLFDLFVQGPRALARSEGGLGIGLTVVRRLVELHGGNVTLQSDGPGTGSEFVVRLPLQDVRQSHAPAEQ